MVDIKKKSPEKSPLGRVTSWNEPKGKKLGGQGKKMSSNDIKMQVIGWVGGWVGVGCLVKTHVSG